MSGHKIVVTKDGLMMRCSPLHSDECKSQARYDWLFTSWTLGDHFYKKKKGRNRFGQILNKFLTGVSRGGRLKTRGEGSTFSAEWWGGVSGALQTWGCELIYQQNQFSTWKRLLPRGEKNQSLLLSVEIRVKNWAHLEVELIHNKRGKFAFMQVWVTSLKYKHTHIILK